MKNIALAILCIGLCFYMAYRKINGLESDRVAGFIALFAAIGVFIV